MASFGTHLTGGTQVSMLGTPKMPFFLLNIDYFCHRRISQGVRRAVALSWSLKKLSFSANQMYFQGKMTLWIARSGGLKQLPGPSLQVLRLHFQGKFPLAPPPRRPVRL